MNEKKKKAIRTRIEAMSEKEMKAEMADIITKDVMRFVEIVVRQRVGLLVEEISERIKQ